MKNPFNKTELPMTQFINAQFFVKYIAITFFIVASLSDASASSESIVAEKFTNSEISSSEAQFEMNGSLQAMELLNQMSKAQRELNYEGRFVYVVSDEISSFEIQHAIINKQEYERLVYLNKSKQEIVRVGHELFCIHPGNHLLRKGSKVSSNPIAERFLTLGEKIYHNYEVGLEYKAVVAGRETIEIQFKAKDKNRYDHHLWLDSETKLLLKVTVADRVLGALETFEFINISVDGSIPASEFTHEGFVRHVASHFAPHESESQFKGTSLASMEWQPNWIPVGFYLTGKDHKVKEDKKILHLMMYTDGLAAITIFVDRVDRASRFVESSQMGALSAFSFGPNLSTIMVNKDAKEGGVQVVNPQERYMVTVVGDVTLNAAEQIAKSVRPQALTNKE